MSGRLRLFFGGVAALFAAGVAASPWIKIGESASTESYVLLQTVNSTRVRYLLLMNLGSTKDASPVRSIVHSFQLECSTKQVKLLGWSTFSMDGARGQLISRGGPADLGVDPEATRPLNEGEEIVWTAGCIPRR